MNKFKKPLHETASKLDFETAFAALEHLPVPNVGGLKPNVDCCAEHISARPKTDCLIEAYSADHSDRPVRNRSVRRANKDFSSARTRLKESAYNVDTADGLRAAMEARATDVATAKLAKIEKIIDLDAKTPDQLQPSYAGKIIIQCPVCRQLFYKKPEDVTVSDTDPTVCNVDEPCPSCGQTSGFTLIGTVAPAEAAVAKKPEPEEEKPLEEPAEDESTDTGAATEQEPTKTEEEPERPAAPMNTEEDGETAGETDVATEDNADEEKKTTESLNRPLMESPITPSNVKAAFSRLIDRHNADVNKAIQRATAADQASGVSESLESSPIAEDVEDINLAGRDSSVLDVLPAADNDKTSSVQDESADLDEAVLSAVKKKTKKKVLTEIASEDQAFKSVVGNPVFKDNITDAEAKADLAAITEGDHQVSEGAQSVIGGLANKIKQSAADLADKAGSATHKANTGTRLTDFASGTPYKKLIFKPDGKKPYIFDLKNTRNNNVLIKNIINFNKKYNLAGSLYLTNDIDISARNNNKEGIVDDAKLAQINYKDSNKNIYIGQIKNNNFDTYYLKKAYDERGVYNGLKYAEKGNRLDSEEADKNSPDTAKPSDSGNTNTASDSAANTNQTNKAGSANAKPVDSAVQTVTIKVNNITKTREINVPGVTTHEEAVKWQKDRVKRRLGTDIANALVIESLTEFMEKPFDAKMKECLNGIHLGITDYKTTGCTIAGKSLIVEGLIHFNDNTERQIKFKFDVADTLNNKSTLRSVNEDLIKGAPVNFTVVADTADKKLLTESVKCQYTADNGLVVDL